MQIAVSHPMFSGITYDDGQLKVQTKAGEEQQIASEPISWAAALQGEILHLVVLLSGEVLQHWQGLKGLAARKMSLGRHVGRPLGGLRLLTDPEERTHLLFLSKAGPGIGASLFHQVYTDEWQDPLLVSSHVSPNSLDYDITWGSDGYLHLAYCSEPEGNLYYRSLEGTELVWSGGAPLTQARTANPSIYYGGEQLYLAWIRPEERRHLVQYRIREKYWGPVQTAGETFDTAGELCWHKLAGQVLLGWAKGEELTWVEAASGSSAAVPDGLHKEYCLVDESEGSSIRVTWSPDTAPSSGEVEETPPENTVEQESSTAGNEASPSPESEQAEAEEAPAETAPPAPTEKTEPQTEEADQPQRAFLKEVWEEYHLLKDKFTELEEAMAEQKETLTRQLVQLQQAVAKLAARSESEPPSLPDAVGEQLSALDSELTDLKQRYYAMREDWRAWRENPTSAIFDRFDERLRRLERGLKQAPKLASSSIESRLAKLEKSVSRLEFVLDQEEIDKSRRRK